MNTLALLMLQSDPAATGLPAGMMIGFTILWLAVVVVLVAAMWKVFEKAGEPGWAAIVPIYNFVILMKIAGKPAWWVVLMFIPFVNFIVLIIAMIAVAKNFGKGTGFGLGLTFLGLIFFPMLAWGDATYHPQPM
jgi:hypothetical protein